MEWWEILRMEITAPTMHSRVVKKQVKNTINQIRTRWRLSKQCTINYLLSGISRSILYFCVVWIQHISYLFSDNYFSQLLYILFFLRLVSLTIFSYDTEMLFINVQVCYFFIRTALQASRSNTTNAQIFNPAASET